MPAPGRLLRATEGKPKSEASIQRLNVRPGHGELQAGTHGRQKGVLGSKGDRVD